MHAVCPLLLEKVPAGHVARHSMVPGFGAYFPIAHDAHDVAPAALL